MRVAIVGGGAAGFFAAITAKEHHPDASVVIFEKSRKVLGKVLVSGGGRCNLTNGCSSVAELVKAYPRGGKSLKRAFSLFGTKDAYNWFEQRGVPLVLQDDGCVFPQSQNSLSVINCLVSQAQRLCVDVEVNTTVESIMQQQDKLLLTFDNDNLPSSLFDKVIVTTGGSPQLSGLKWLANLGHKIESPVPSLFTFNIPKNSVTDLMGVVVENALISLQGTKLKSNGPLLITHWGMSGPAVLKLSAFGARLINSAGYHFKIHVNWINQINQTVVTDTLIEFANSNKLKQVVNGVPFPLPNRLWSFLLNKCSLSPTKKWCEVGKTDINKLVNALTNDEYEVRGKTTFREEFVTCGGVSLDSVNLDTMQSKIVPNLYFAGEVLDIDAITGGFNLQNAWTTGYIAGKLM